MGQQTKLTPAFATRSKRPQRSTMPFSDLRGVVFRGAAAGKKAGRRRATG